MLLSSSAVPSKCLQLKAIGGILDTSSDRFTDLPLISASSDITGSSLGLSDSSIYKTFYQFSLFNAFILIIGNPAGLSLFNMRKRGYYFKIAK
jgi:hypothetical protein